MSNISITAICNKALYLLKADDRISSIDEDSIEARLCNAFFDDALDTLTELHPWNFAVERAALAESDNAPLFGFTKKFQLPTDPYCLKVLDVVDSSDYPILAWQIAGRFIETDGEDIMIRYLKRISNLTEVSSLFREALAYYLASQIAEPLTRSTEIEQVMVKKYDHAIKKAKRADSLQGTYKLETDDDYSWLASRYTDSTRADKNYR